MLEGRARHDNQAKTSTDPNYYHSVTADDGALGEQYLRDFHDNKKTIPTILTTSQKLSTGVDARNIRNIILVSFEGPDRRLAFDAGRSVSNILRT